MSLSLGTSVFAVCLIISMDAAVLLWLCESGGLAEMEEQSREYREKVCVGGWWVGCFLLLTHWFSSKVLDSFAFCLEFLLH